MRHLGIYNSEIFSTLNRKKQHHEYIQVVMHMSAIHYKQKDKTKIRGKAHALNVLSPWTILCPITHTDHLYSTYYLPLPRPNCMKSTP
jgi:hypothetical protein